jgi:RNA polymerase sigma-70 factor, ECF subfamily
MAAPGSCPIHPAAPGTDRMADPFRSPEPLIRRVYAYVAYRIGDGPEAEDVTSDTFERAVRYRDRYDPRKGEPAAWLIGIARRCIADALARPQDVSGEEIDVMSPFDLEETSVARTDLRAGLRTLADRDRELLALRYGADLTAREIAAILGITPHAVEVALHRALARLRSALESPARSTEEPARARHAL